MLLLCLHKDFMPHVMPCKAYSKLKYQVTRHTIIYIMFLYVFVSSCIIPKVCSLVPTEYSLYIVKGITYNFVIVISLQNTQPLKLKS